MTDTNTAEREAAEQWLRDRYGAYRGHFAWRELEEAFLAGRASLAASAGSEPVATIKSWTNGSYWRTYNVVFHRDDLPVGTDLYTHPSPPEGMAGWVSVDERLPQPFTPVLIHPRPTDYCCEGEVNTQRQWSYGEYETGFGHHQIKCKVTHWQPMPAPPLPASEAKEP